MSLSRQLLAKVDAQLRAELDQTEEVQLVKVPVSSAVWSTWRRYCEIAGVPMGRGLGILLHRELASLAGQDIETVATRIQVREAEIEKRTLDLAEREEALRRKETELTVRERQLDLRNQTRAREITAAAGGQKPPGRNDPCWCDSGKKFKFCHGRPA